MLKKIVILGPESTGKSSLCKQLAKHYKTEWVPEYAREFLLKNGINYSYEDLLTIAKGQTESEDYYNLRLTTHDSRLLFIDTDMYVMKVWCEFVFGKCHKYILDQIVQRKYDLYLLCNIDLPWRKDELREYPEVEPRQRLYMMYLDIMVNQDTPWVIISGTEDQRFSKAVKAVEKLIEPKKH